MMRRGIGVVFIVCVVLALPSGAARGERPHRGEQEVSVRVEGLAPFEPGTSVDRARKEAIRDARRNAVLQAQVILSAETRVEGTRLAALRVRARALGYVESIEILKEGVVPGSGPHRYRISARALVRPLSRFSAAAALGWERPGPWEPVASLEVRGDAEEQAVAAVRGALERCGVLLAEGEDHVPALIVHLRVAASDGEGGHSVRADWDVRTDGDLSRGEPVRFRGQWLRTGEGNPPNWWWEALGTVVAQDVTRAWTMPRSTVIRFTDVTEAQKWALAAVAAEGGEEGVSVEEQNDALALRLSVSGNPVSVADALLERAGLHGKMKLVHADLAGLIYRGRHGAKR